MTTAGESLRNRRMASGRLVAEIAAQVGISESHYCDLETFDDLYQTLDLEQLCVLARTLGAEVRDLFPQESDYLPAELDRGPAWLAKALADALGKDVAGLATFEKRAGWDMGCFPADPGACRKWNVQCLRDVCGVLGVSWLRALPEAADFAGG